MHPVEARIRASLLAAPPLELDFPFWYKLAYSADEPVLVLGPGALRVATALDEYGIRTVAWLAEDETAPPGAGGSLTIIRGAGSELALPGPFGFVIAPFNSLSSEQMGHDARRMLTALHGALRLGGRLALALTLPDVAQLAEAAGPRGGPLRCVRVEPGPAAGQQFFVWEQAQCWPYEQRLERRVIAEVVDERGQSLGRWLHQATHHYLWPREVVALLELAGFSLEAQHGGYRGEPLTGESQVQVWVGRKVVAGP
jgi:hypothetical protein